MMEPDGQQQNIAVTDISDDDLFQPKTSSLPSDNQYPPDLSDEVGSNRNSITSDEETDVGFLNKTRSFPDLTKSARAQQQQDLAIMEEKLRKREEALQQKEIRLQRQQNEAMIRGYPRVYTGEQPIYPGTGGGYNWSGAMAYSGQQSSHTQPTTYLYRPNEQQWSRPHGKCHHDA